MKEFAIARIERDALGWVAVKWRFSPVKADLYVLHKSVGMLILMLVALRLLWRLANTTPDLPRDMALWQRRCARASYVLLYTVLFAMPLTGWILNSAANIPFRIFWVVPLPSLTDPAKDTADLAALVHFTLFALLIALLLVHIGAALRHHYVRRDEVLTRMLPNLLHVRMASVYVIVALVLGAAAPPAAAIEWSMDRSRSRLEFVATFERAPAPGVFHDFDARVQFDAAKPNDNRLDVKIAVPSVDMRSASLNKAVRAPEWFDAVRFPAAEFHATDVQRVEADRYVARGTLSLKGIRRVLSVPFVWREAANAALMQGELIVDRALFGIGAGEWMASNVVAREIRVTFSVALRRSPSP